MEGSTNARAKTQEGRYSMFCNDIIGNSHQTFFAVHGGITFVEKVTQTQEKLSPDNIFREILRSTDRWS